MANGNGPRWWPTVTIALMASVASGLSAWAAATSRAPSAKDVKEIVAVHSPYVADRKLIDYRLEQIEKKIDLLLERGSDGKAGSSAPGK